MAKKTVSINEIEATEFDELVAKHYGIEDYCVQAAEEWPNGFERTFHISQSDLNDPDLPREITHARKKWMYTAYTFLTDLIRQGIVEKADEYKLYHLY